MLHLGRWCGRACALSLTAMKWMSSWLAMTCRGTEGRATIWLGSRVELGVGWARRGEGSRCAHLLLRNDECGIEALQEILRVVQQQSPKRQVLLQQIEHVHADRVMRRTGSVELHED